MALSVQMSKQGTVAVLTPKGPVVEDDLADVAGPFDQLLAESGDHVVLHLNAVPFLDSKGLEWLLESRRKMAQLGAGLKLAAPSPLCREILRITTLEDQFEIYDDVSAAVRSFL